MAKDHRRLVWCHVGCPARGASDEIGYASREDGGKNVDGDAFDGGKEGLMLCDGAAMGVSTFLESFHRVSQ